MKGAPVVVGAFLGAVCSASLGLLGLFLTQDLHEVADPVGWAILAALIPTPWGGLAGGCGAWFLTVRAGSLRSFRRLLVEATFLGGVIGFAMFAIGSYESGEPGPESVMWLMTGGGAMSALLIGSVLKSRYWPGSRSSEPPKSWMM